MGFVMQAARRTRCLEIPWASVKEQAIADMEDEVYQPEEMARFAFLQFERVSRA
jgi:hypothetical protein